MVKSVLVRFSTNRNQVGGDDIFGSGFRDPSHLEKYYTGSGTVYQLGTAWHLDHRSVVIDPPAAAADATVSRNDIVAYAREQMSRAGRRGAQNARAADFGQIFIHGFNTKFTRAVEVAAQISASYHPGSDSTFLFSWPSAGAGVSLDSYKNDRTAAERSDKAIAAVLLSLISFLNSLNASERPPLNIVTHSMGNHALSGAIQVIAQSDPGQIKKDLFEGSVLMAADENQDALSDARRLAPLVTLAKRVTSYYSGHDLVLALSQLVNGRVPLGLVKPAGLASLDKRVTAVDCSDVASTVDESGKTEYGHGYFRGSPWVINDVRQVLLNMAPGDIAGRLPDMVDPADGHAWWIPYDSGAAHP